MISRLTFVTIMKFVHQKLALQRQSRGQGLKAKGENKKSVPQLCAKWQMNIAQQAGVLANFPQGISVGTSM